MSDDSTQQPANGKPVDGSPAEREPVDGTAVDGEPVDGSPAAGAQPAQSDAPAAGAQRAEAAPGDQAEQSGAKKPADRSRKWWHKQRFVIPIAVVVLLAAALAVGMWLRSERETASPAAGAADASAAPSAPASGGPDAQPSPDGARGDDAPDPRTAQVCERIVAFQRDVQANGIDLLEAANELSEIEQQARGTRLAEQANALAEEAEDFMFGRSDAQAVFDRGEDLVSAC